MKTTTKKLLYYKIDFLLYLLNMTYVAKTLYDKSRKKLMWAAANKSALLRQSYVRLEVVTPEEWRQMIQPPPHCFYF